MMRAGWLVAEARWLRSLRTTEVWKVIDSTCAVLRNGKDFTIADGEAFELRKACRTVGIVDSKANEDIGAADRDTRDLMPN